MDRRKFINTAVVAPVAVKYASLTNLFGVAVSISPLTAQRIFEEEVAHSVSTKHWDHIRVNDFVHIPEHWLESEDTNRGPYHIDGQYVTQLLAVRKSDGTHFYCTLSIPDDRPISEEFLRTKCQLATLRFDGWKDCGCKVGTDCNLHGGGSTLQVTDSE